MMTSILRVETLAPFFSLTFDDGPDPGTTPAILSVLRRHNARATFFLIGSKVDRHSDVVRRIIDEGHEVGNHSYSHPYFLKSKDGEILTELDRAQAAIFDACEAVPSLFRAPHGRMTRHQHLMVPNNRSLRHCYWSVDPKDWRDKDAELVGNRLVENTNPGDIAVLHDTLSTSVAAIGGALARLADAGLTSIPVCELLNLGEVTPQQMPVSVP